MLLIFRLINLLKKVSQFRDGMEKNNQQMDFLHIIFF